VETVVDARGCADMVNLLRAGPADPESSTVFSKRIRRYYSRSVERA